MPQTIDPEWARDRLEWWIRTASEARGWTNNRRASWVDPGAELTLLRRHEHQTRTILGHVLQRDDVATLLIPSSSTIGRVFVPNGIELAEYAIGILDTAADTLAHVTGTQAPTMSADALHEDVWRAASKLWSNGHYAEAVQRAATFLNADVQDRVGRTDVSDQQLMAQAFSTAPPEPGKPRLRWPGDDTDLTVKAMRTGLLSFSQGVFAAIRNPATHSTEEMPKQIALEQLATLSTLARWVDRCERVTAQA